MRFHLPSFLYHFDIITPVDMPYCHYNFRLYLYPGRPVKTETLQHLVNHALLSALRDPQGKQTTTEYSSLFETPSDTYLDALSEALTDTQTYLQRCPRDEPREVGEVVKYDYQIDLQEVSRILQAVRLAEDVKLVRALVKHNRFVSLRMLRECIKTRFGVVFSDRRLTLSLNALERQGVLKRSKTLHITGREVVKEEKKRRSWLRKEEKEG
jgi:hypothetical protein